jgi:hypothetical protein
MRFKTRNRFEDNNLSQTSALESVCADEQKLPVLHSPRATTA